MSWWRGPDLALAPPRWSDRPVNASVDDDRLPGEESRPPRAQVRAEIADLPRPTHPTYRYLFGVAAQLLVQPDACLGGGFGLQLTQPVGKIVRTPSAISERAHALPRPRLDPVTKARSRPRNPRPRITGARQAAAAL